MIVKSTRIALEVVAGTLAVVVLLSMVALWRLSKEPVRLDFLTPHIEAALDELDSGLFVQIGRTELIWAGERRSIEFHTRDLRIRNRDGVAVAAFPDVVVRLSLRALVQGVIAPTVIEVVGARIRLAREVDGSFAIVRQLGVRQLAGDEAAESGAELSEVLPAIIRQLMSKPDVGQPLSFLSAVRIRRGQVTIDDRRLGLVWRAPVADIELRRDSAGLAGEVDLVLAVGDSQTRLSGDFLFPRGGDRISARGQFVGLQSEALIPLVPRLGPLAGLTMAFDGTLRAALSVDGRVESVDFEIAGVNGRLEAPDTFSEPLDLRRIALRGRAIGAEQQIDIETLSVQWGTAERPGPEILASVSLAATGPGFGGDLSVGAEAVVTGLDVSELDRYWPVSLKPGRKWVVGNIVRGHLDEVRVQTALYLPDGRMDQIELRRLDGAMSYRDLAIHYWRPMPPATGISGTAVFDHKSVTFTSRGARLQELRVESGVVKIVGLDAGKETVKLDLDFGGPLRNGLELLDHDRLRLIRELGIDPAGAEGRFTGNLKLGIPIYVRTTLDNIGVWAEAQLEQATIRRLLLGQDATEGQLAVTVDKAAMEVRGPLRFGGVPVEIVWNENFAEDAAIRSQLEARIPEIDDAGRKALGLDFSPYLEGPVAVELSYVSDRAKNGRLDASVDLRDAGLALPEIYWSKAAGLPGNAELTLGLSALKLATIESFEVRAGTLRGSGRGRFDDSGKKVTSLALDAFAFNGSQLEQVTVDWLGEATAVHIGGGTIDAAPFLAGEDARTTQPLEPRKPAPGATPSGAPESDAVAPDLERPALPRKPAPEAVEASPLREPRTEPYVFAPFALKAPRLNAIQFGPGRFIESVALELRRGRNGWQRIAVEALLPRQLWSPEPAPEEAGQEAAKGGSEEPATAQGQVPQPGAIQVPESGTAVRRLRMDYGPQDAGGYRFVFESNDMGAALRALGKFDTIHGGRVAIVGTSAGPMPNAPLEARIEARDYVLVDAPAMVRLLTVASLTGINDAMKGKGIRFSRLIGAFTLTDGIMETELLRAFGPALGLTARGKIDFDESRVDLEGTAVPAYSVNRVLNLIPLLGPILTGGEGEGLFAVTYRMTGELDDPNVDVNALSALAPGFLRALFSGRSGGGDGADRPRALPERIER
jgi:hypothetical protein